MVLYKPPYYTDEQIQQIDEKKIIFPYSDKYMTYDALKRQYIPTENLLIKHDIHLNEFVQSDDQGDINEELEYISDQIYTYIYKCSGSSIDTLKFRIAKGIARGITPLRFRLLFEEILYKQARYYVDNDDPSKSTGLDMEQKTYLSKGIINTENRQISPNVKVMLERLGLCWRGSYDQYFLNYSARNDW